MLVLLLAALLGACALFIVMAPLFAPGRMARAAAEAEAGGLVEREAMAKQALREVEFDHQLGNLAEDDYRALRERYMRRALAAMKGRYNRERAVDDLIEAQVRALRDAEAAKAVGRVKGSGAASATARGGGAVRPGAAGSATARKRSGGGSSGKHQNGNRPGKGRT